jgi:hypothetical protein
MWLFHCAHSVYDLEAVGKGYFDGLNFGYTVALSPIKGGRWDCFVERPGMQASVKGMIFLTVLATDEVPDVNGIGFVKNKPGSRLFNGERF